MSLELGLCKNYISVVVTTQYPLSSRLSTHTFNINHTNLNFSFFKILNGHGPKHVLIKDFHDYLLRCDVYVDYDKNKYDPITNCSSKVVFYMKQNFDSPAYCFHAIRRIKPEKKQNKEPIKVDLMEPSISSSSSSSSSESCRLFDILSSSSSSTEYNDDVCEAIYGLHLTMHDMLKEQHNTTCQITKLIATINKHIKQTHKSNNTSLFNK